VSAQKEPPASDFARAIGYALNQWQALTRFAMDGRLDLDNNLCERQLRDVAIGRKNYLFAGSDEAAQRTAVLYSSEPPINAVTGGQGGATPHAAGATEVERSAPNLPDSPQRTAARSRWARLLARIYEVFPLLCPDCSAEMRVLAFIAAAEPVDDILRHLGLPATPPPLSPARGPPQHALGFDADPGLHIDQTPAFDPTEAEPAPDFDFDQSRGA